MPTRLEHANITVQDVDAAIAFLLCVDPDFTILHDSGTGGDHRWVHLGTTHGYFALETPHDPQASPEHRRRYHDFGVNHIGLVVDDVDAVAQRLQAADYPETYVADPHPTRIRRYFQDPSGMEWELVQYLTDDPAARFAYD